MGHPPPSRCRLVFEEWVPHLAHGSSCVCHHSGAGAAPSVAGSSSVGRDLEGRGDWPSPWASLLSVGGGPHPLHGGSSLSSGRLDPDKGLDVRTPPLAEEPLLSRRPSDRAASGPCPLWRASRAAFNQDMAARQGGRPCREMQHSTGKLWKDVSSMDRHRCSGYIMA